MAGDVGEGKREVRRARYWRGPVVGEKVTQVWQGYAARLFLSFGRLTPKRPLPDGSPGRPRGEFELSNMMSLSDWSLTLNGRLLADSASRDRTREKAIQRLARKRLLLVEIEEPSHWTVLRFSHGVVLSTKNMPGVRERRPHWLLRSGEADWRPVAPMGMGYHCRLRKGG